MSRNWNLTGLYKSQRDRMPAKRSRTLRHSAAQGSQLVMPRPPEDVADCIDCGAKEDSTTHYMKCVERRPI